LSALSSRSELHPPLITHPTLLISALETALRATSQSTRKFLLGRGSSHPRSPSSTNTCATTLHKDGCLVWSRGEPSCSCESLTLTTPAAVYCSPRPTTLRVTAIGCQLGGRHPTATHRPRVRTDTPVDRQRRPIDHSPGLCPPTDRAGSRTAVFHLRRSQSQAV
jgi:hypothetical protein